MKRAHIVCYLPHKTSLRLKMKGKKIPVPITTSVTAMALSALILELKWGRDDQVFSSTLWDLL